MASSTGTTTTADGLSTSGGSSCSSPPTSAVTKVALVGATGRLGQRALQKLLERKIPVKCLIRSSSPPDRLLELQKQVQLQQPEQDNNDPSSSLLEFVTDGDVTNRESVKELLTGCSHCLALFGATRRTKWSEFLFAAEASEDSDPSHAKPVNYKSMQLFIDCAQESTECQHLVRITGKGEDPWSFFSVLINGLGSMAKGWNYEGEQVLRKQKQQQQDDKKQQQHHLDYTIIRPGIMKEDYDPKENKVYLELADNGGDLPVSAVSYDQIAELCIEALFQPQARNTTLTAMNVPIPATYQESLPSSLSKPSIAEQLQIVQKDSRAFPESLIDEHKRAVKLVFRSIAAALAAILVALVLQVVS